MVPYPVTAALEVERVSYNMVFKFPCPLHLTQYSFTIVRQDTTMTSLPLALPKADLHLDTVKSSKEWGSVP